MEKGTERGLDTHTERERQTDRQRDRERQRETETGTETETARDSNTYIIIIMRVASVVRIEVYPIAVLGCCVPENACPTHSISHYNLTPSQNTLLCTRFDSLDCLALKVYLTSARVIYL